MVVLNSLVGTRWVDAVAGPDVLRTSAPIHPDRRHTYILLRTPTTWRTRAIVPDVQQKACGRQAPHGQRVGPPDSCRRGSRQKVEGGRVAGAYDGEVASIEGGHVPDRQAFCGGDHGGINCSERQVAIDLDQFGDTEPVRRSDVLGDQVARGEVPEEADFSVVPKSSAEQVDHLGHYEDGHEQRPRMGLEQFEAVRVVIVVCVYVGVQGASID
jgi:hypothetical protein